MAVLGAQVAGRSCGVVGGASSGCSCVLAVASLPGQVSSVRRRAGGWEPRRNHQKDLRAWMPCRWPCAVRPVTMGGWSAAATGSATSRSRPACPTATVDRVLHGRPGVSARAVRAVEAAVLELERQQSQVRLSRRTLLVDVVVDAPGALPGRRDRPRSRRRCRPRARHRAGALHDERGCLARASWPRRSTPWASAGRVSHGLVLKAPDDPAVAAAVRRARQRGIPTVTLVTDVSDSRPGGVRRPRQRRGRRDGRLPPHPPARHGRWARCSRR